MIMLHAVVCFLSRKKVADKSRSKRDLLHELVFVGDSTIVNEWFVPNIFVSEKIVC